MDDFVKEPDRMEFVDSDHIMNYLESNMDENSLMKSGEPMSDDTAAMDDDCMSERLTSAEGLLDNLIKSVCAGIDESTLIDKGDTNLSIIPDNDQSSDSDITKSVQLDFIENSLLKKVSPVENFKKSFDTASSDTNDSVDSCLKLKESPIKKNYGTSSEDLNKNKKTSLPSTDDDSDIMIIEKTDDKKKGEEKDDDCEIIVEKDLSTVGVNVNLRTENTDSSSSAGSKDTSERAFHLSDNMRKDLSRLAFPSKAALGLSATQRQMAPHSPLRLQGTQSSAMEDQSRLVFPSNAALALSTTQKKKLPSLRPMRSKPSTRITIAEALEKAQDAQKSISEASPKMSTEKVEKHQGLSACQVIRKLGSLEPVEPERDFVGFDEHSRNFTNALLVDTNHVSKTSFDIRSKEGIEKLLIHKQPSPSAHSPALSVDDMDEMRKAGNSQEKPRAKGKSCSRYKLTPKMSELLKFTFDHEHFPSSVNMVRLAKIMGISWSQVRNWFTNRRVENKRNCIFPRDKVLNYCPYCCISLKTEAEQKGHLFVSHHIRKILGTECAETETKMPKWKHRQVDLISSSSRTSSRELSPSGSNSTGEPLSDGEEVEAKGDKLGKRWKDSFLMNKKGKSKIHVGTDSERTPKNEYGLGITNKEINSAFTRIDSDENTESFTKVERDDVSSKDQSVCGETVRKGANTMGTTFNKYETTSQEHTKGISQIYRKGMGIKDREDQSKPGYLGYKTQVLTLKSNSLPLKNIQGGQKSTHVPQKKTFYIEECIMGYQCPRCYKIFQTEWQLIKHTMTHLLFMCDICEESFPTEHELKRHVHDHLTSAYEEETYYCQFSCKMCHSLKCECYEPQVYIPKEFPKALERPQKAKRSKKTFSSKPFAGPNDHLRVTFGSYQKHMQQLPGSSDGGGVELSCRIPLDKRVTQSYSKVTNTGNTAPKPDNNNKSVDNEKVSKEREPVPSITVEQMPETTEKPKLTVRKDLLSDTTKQTTELKEMESSSTTAVTPSSTLASEPSQKTDPVQSIGSETDVQKKARGRPFGSRNSAKSKEYVYMDADFYYMCEICDSSFLSKAELQEHMFFHRLKSRSRRGEKRSLEESEDSNKKAKVDESSSEVSETINLLGFERYKCDICSNHFSNKTNLNRHKTQAHSEDLSPESLEVLKCNYCEKTYRRERELRRHLKHACVSAPKHLKSVLTVGTTLITLQEKGDGPHFTIVSKTLGTLLSQNSVPQVSKGPYKCRYCPLVTKREREMKRHIWKHCAFTPKIIKTRCKQGASLEELGFHCQSDEVEDMLMSGVAVTAETDGEEEAGSSEPNSLTETPPPPPAKTPEPTPSVSSDKHKEPLVCAYCGIWYYRKISLIRHMKERCIVIPVPDRERLNQGADVCDTADNNAENPKMLSSVKGIYQKVQGQGYKLAIKKEENDKKYSGKSTASASSLILADLKSTLTQLQESSEKALKETVPNVKAAVSESPTKDSSLLEKPDHLQGKKGAKQKGTRCIRCHETFKTPDAVLAHSSIHHGPKKGLYRCKLCNERFQRYKQLREHVWTHTEETPYKCHLCNANFRLSDSILNHLSSIHSYTKAHEKNIFKWLPGRNGKYRVLEDAPEVQESSSSTLECEETLEGMDTNLDNLAEDMVVTDKIWTEGKVSTSHEKSDSKSPKATSKEKDARNEKETKLSSRVDKQNDGSKAKEADKEGADKCSAKAVTKEPGKETKLDGDSVAKSEGKTESKGVAEPKKSDSDQRITKKILPKRTSTDKSSSSGGGDDDEGELLSLDNLDSIIETVNLTDESFLE